MKKARFPLVFLCVVLLLTSAMLLLDQKNEDSEKVKIYSLVQFNDIIPLSSTIEDVRRIVPIEKLYVTSFGGVAEFPSNDEKWIQIKFFGPKLVVESIDVVDNPWA